MITTRSLTKRYGAVTAVSSVDLDVAPGDRYGLLGPNGSGKTTLVRMLLGLVYPTGGEIRLLGHAVPKRVRQALPEVGALVEQPAAIPHLSGRTNLAVIDAAGPHGARRTRRARIEEALDRVGLAGVDRRPVRAYSLGMRQRLGLAAALLRRPRLLILDEPTNGLDPRGIKEIRELLRTLNADGTTIFLSSHILSEVDGLCDRVGIVDRGRLVRQAELAELREPTGRVLVDTPDPAAAAALLDGEVEAREGGRLLIRAADPAALNARLVGGGVPVREIAAQRRTLEQVVFELTSAGSDRLARADTGLERPGRGQERVGEGNASTDEMAGRDPLGSGAGRAGPGRGSAGSDGAAEGDPGAAGAAAAPPDRADAENPGGGA
ncbi:MAG TPA: ABC transporter ATP-binding protein [Pseudonocardiaceae bacterium]|nr:ABC transporter ATP-binding protein [Pseudonocardiaceae bacterium]